MRQMEAKKDKCGKSRTTGNKSGCGRDNNPSKIK